MQITEYDDSILYARECYNRMRESSMFEIDIENAITVIFGESGNKKKGNNVKLAAVAFSKDVYSAEEADSIWRSYEFRYLTKKYDFNRKVPPCHGAIEMDNGDYVVVMERNAGVKTSFSEQLKMMDKTENFEDLLLPDYDFEEDEVFMSSAEQEKQNVEIMDIPMGEQQTSGKGLLVKDFEKLLEETSKAASNADAVIQAISMLNAKSLVKVPSDEDLLEFGDYFMNRYGSNQKVMKKIQTNWGEDGPRIFRLIAGADSNQFIAEMDEEYERLSSTKRKMINKLVDYILSRPGWVQASVNYDLDDYNTYFVDEGETEEHIAFARKELRAEATRMLLDGAGMTIRFKDPQYPDKEVVCGIRSHGQKFSTISASEMKACAECQPDGHQEFPVDLYQRADIIF